MEDVSTIEYEQSARKKINILSPLKYKKFNNDDLIDLYKK